MTDHVLKIANGDQCCYCGACLAVCPGVENKNLFISDFSDEGWELEIKNEEKCKTCTLCIDSCPMNVVDYKDIIPEITPKIDEQTKNHLLGKHYNTYIGHSADNEMRFTGASGGVISSIIKFAFEKKKIDGVICIKPGLKDRSEYLAFIANTHEEFVTSQGSHYFPLPAFMALSQVIYGKYRNVIVIGLPCHITSLRLGEKRIKKLKNRVFLSIGLFCGGTTDFRLASYLESRVNLEKRAKAVLFRQGHWPGAIKIVENSNLSHDINGIERDYHQFTSLLPACMFCADHSSELADISVGDPWIPKILDRNDGGYSSIVTRTDRGNRLISEMILSKKIIFENSTADEVIDGQRGPIDFKKRGLAPRLFFRKLFFADVPNIKNANLMRSDLVDYFAAILMFALYYVTKLEWFWKLNAKLSTKFVHYYTKPINFILKRNKIVSRITKKLFKNSKFIEIFLLNILNYKKNKLFGRIGFRLRNTVFYDIILLQIKTFNRVHIPSDYIHTDQSDIDYDNINQTHIPLEIKHADRKLNLIDIRFDFMMPAEKHKLNNLVTDYCKYGDMGGQCYQKVEKWFKAVRFGYGSAYFSSLTVAQRLINLSILFSLFDKDGLLSQTQKEQFKKIVSQEYLFLNSFNTFHYIRKNNFIFCELLAIILTDKLVFKKNTLPSNISLLEKEITNQINSDGSTYEGSLGYDKFIFENLFMLWICGATQNKQIVLELFNKLYEVSNENYKLPGIGDVSCEQVISAFFGENVLDCTTLFQIVSDEFSSGLTTTNDKEKMHIWSLIRNVVVDESNKKSPLNEVLLKKSDFYTCKDYIVWRYPNLQIVLKTGGIISKGRGTHSHLDQGSITSCLYGEELIVDPGTFSYFSSVMDRSLCVSSHSHNLSALKGYEAAKKTGTFSFEQAVDLSVLQANKNEGFFLVPGPIKGSNRNDYIRQILIKAEEYYVIDNFLTEDTWSSRMHFHPNFKLKFVDGIIVAKSQKNIVRLSVSCRSKIEISIKKYTYSDHYGQGTDAYAVLIESLEDCKKIEWCFNYVKKI